MSIALARQGEFEILKALTSEPITLRLFTNDIYPHSDIVFRDLKQVSGSGYQPQTLSPLNWKISIINGSYTASYPEVEFLFLNPFKNEIFGNYATKTVGGLQKVLWADRSEQAPMHIIIRGDRITVTPTLRLPKCQTEPEIV